MPTLAHATASPNSQNVNTPAGVIRFAHADHDAARLRKDAATIAQARASEDADTIA
jgi:hypothetical protein